MRKVGACHLKPMELANQRNYLVVESNDLVRYGRYNLTAQQFNILCYCISKIKPGMEEFETYDFDLKDLCAVCGISQNTKNYANFKENIEKLANITFWWETDEAHELHRLFEKVKIYKRDTRVSIKIDDVLKPHLLNQRENFVAYLFENVLVMKSKYSKYLYRLLKTFAYMGEYETSLIVLKDSLQCSEDYSGRYDNFRKYVLDKAMEEINQYTDLKVSYKPIRVGRSIQKIHFTIKPKERDEEVRAMLERGIVLNRIENEKNQMRLEGFEEDE